MSETSELRAASLVAVSGLILIPIEKVRSLSYIAKKGYWVNSLKEPAAVLVCGEKGPSAFDIEGRETPLSDLIRQVPGLEAVLKKHQR